MKIQEIIPLHWVLLKLVIQPISDLLLRVATIILIAVLCDQRLLSRWENDTYGILQSISTRIRK